MFSLGPREMPLRARLPAIAFFLKFQMRSQLMVQSTSVHLVYQTRKQERSLCVVRSLPFALFQNKENILTQDKKISKRLQKTTLNSLFVNIFFEKKFFVTLVFFNLLHIFHLCSLNRKKPSFNLLIASKN